MTKQTDKQTDIENYKLDYYISNIMAHIRCRSITDASIHDYFHTRTDHHAILLSLTHIIIDLAKSRDNMTPSFLTSPKAGYSQSTINMVTSRDN